MTYYKKRSPRGALDVCGNAQAYLTSQASRIVNVLVENLCGCMIGWPVIASQDGHVETVSHNVRPVWHVSCSITSFRAKVCNCTPAWYLHNTFNKFRPYNALYYITHLIKLTKVSLLRCPNEVCHNDSSLFTDNQFNILIISITCLWEKKTQHHLFLVQRLATLSHSWRKCLLMVKGSTTQEPLGSSSHADLTEQMHHVTL